MGFDGEVWLVRGTDRGEETGEVGEIVIDDVDFPWLSGRFTAGPAYDAVEPLFTRELALMEDEDWEAWEVVETEIRRRVSLVSPRGAVPEFLLHIQGDAAWFRWSDEAFEEG
ncbi:hypothetical protein SAMN04487983_1001458 [Streptomyces sp. yr375]|uniref:hypothetical protein n=1 Tax=Streptomyces sp. yr375 TaxID=1761906 RepID=UPI0008AF1CD6|nr:hypothetical protein [Streptomyces sp. yr375]SEP76777.1 hypothetical protein SAMN04487983_1001458 [Streptomyces sp. yr375]